MKTDFSFRPLCGMCNEFKRHLPPNNGWGECRFAGRVNELNECRKPIRNDNQRRIGFPKFVG